MRRIIRAMSAFLVHKISTATWSDVRSWGNSRIIWTSGFFLILVPIAAKVLIPFAGEHSVRLPCCESPVTFEVGLPFHWTLFYLAAVFFFIAQTIYAFRCPEVIKQFQSFEEFHRAHPGTVVLMEWLRRVTEKLNHEPLNEFVDDLCSALGVAAEERRIINQKLGEVIQPAKDTQPPAAAESRRQLYETLANSFRNGSNEPSAVADTFDAVRRGASRLSPNAKRASVGFFAAGFILFLAVLAENFYTVIKIAFAS